jgi:ABC-type arginine/histidine transport system permease subunit
MEPHRFTYEAMGTHWAVSLWDTLDPVVRTAMEQDVLAQSQAFDATFSRFKDTSLVTIVSLYDLTGAVQLALGDADWRKFFIEGQLFAAAIYFVACFAMSRYSLWLEKHLNTGTRRQ